MRWLRWFLAGALAVPLFHQIVLGLLFLGGVTSRAPFSLQPTQPWHVPQLLSLSFWGGVWGILLGLLLERIRSNRAFWITAFVFGAIAPTLVAGLVVAPLKGLPSGGGGDPKLIATGFAINAAWGIGTALLARLMSRKAQPR